MVDVDRDWLGKKKVLERYPLTSAYVSVITDVQGELTESTRYASQPMSDSEREKVRKLLKALDVDWDNVLRVVSGAFEVLALAFPEKAAAYQQASGALLPDGLAVINTSYRNEAGETERIAKRVEAEPAIKALLEESSLNGVKLTTWYEKLVDVGRRLGPLAAQLDVPTARAEDVLREFKARQKWTSMVTTLRRTCELAGWSTEDTMSFFEQVDKLSSEREAPKEEKPVTPPVGGGGTTPVP